MFSQVWSSSANYSALQQFIHFIYRSRVICALTGNRCMWSVLAVIRCKGVKAHLQVCTFTPRTILSLNQVCSVIAFWLSGSERYGLTVQTNKQTKKTLHETQAQIHIAYAGGPKRPPPFVDGLRAPWINRRSEAPDSNSCTWFPLACLYMGWSSFKFSVILNIACCR